MTERYIYSPTELNHEVKMHLEAGFSRIWLEAEVSNLSRPASGHLYFSLKDDRCQIRCALFRSAASKQAVQPENGNKVLVSGRITLYEARGDYQLIVDSLRGAGEGLLQQQFEALKRKLDEEGLFDPKRKQPLPSYPARIALITSPSGAVVRDMLQILERRWPIATARIYSVPVQGDEAPAAIVRAIGLASQQGWADIILLGRGGGSLEDLQAFNDERVARAIADCSIPLVSAVGHETDFSISDFVADLRAPTPSAAAELATPDARVLKEKLSRFQRQLFVRMQDCKNVAAQKVDHLGHRLQQVHPRRRLDDQRQRLELAKVSLGKEIGRRLQQDTLTVTHLKRQLSVLHPSRLISAAREHFESVSALFSRLMGSSMESRADKFGSVVRTLNAVSPLETVARGYALLTVTGTQDVVTRTDMVPEDRRITAQVADGRLFCSVDETDQEGPETLLPAVDQ